MEGRWPEHHCASREHDRERKKIRKSCKDGKRYRESSRYLNPIWSAIADQLAAPSTRDTLCLASEGASRQPSRLKLPVKLKQELGLSG